MSRKLREALIERDAARSRADKLSRELLAKTRLMMADPTTRDWVRLAARVHHLEALCAEHGIDTTPPARPTGTWAERHLLPSPAVAAATGRGDGEGAVVVSPLATSYGVEWSGLGNALP